MKIDVNPIIKRNVVPAMRRAAAKHIDEALGTPKLWGAREYVQANHQVPEGFYVIYTRLPGVEDRTYYFGEIAKKILGGVETLKFQTLTRKSSVDWLFHIDASTLLWGPHVHPQMFLYGLPESDELIADDREEEEV